MWICCMLFIVSTFGDDLNIDEHGCVGITGQTWCEPLQECIIPWKTPCIAENQSNCPCPSPLECSEDQFIKLVDGTENNCCGGSYQCIDCTEDCPQKICSQDQTLYISPTSCCSVCIPLFPSAPGPVVEEEHDSEVPCSCPMVVCSEDQFLSLIPGTENNCCGGSYECLNCVDVNCKQPSCCESGEFACCSSCHYEEPFLDDHDCLRITGSAWCEPLQQCIIPWKTPCIAEGQPHCPCPVVECAEGQFIKLVDGTENNCCGGTYQCSDCPITHFCSQESQEHKTCPEGDEFYIPPNNCHGICIPSLHKECPDVMCAMFCEHGFSTDENGCPICVCNSAPSCPEIMCNLYCESGFSKDENGCEMCLCNPKPLCPEVMCMLYCEHGFKTGENGCEKCECILDHPPVVEPCTRISCECPIGFSNKTTTDENGCPTCNCCSPPGLCHCENGFYEELLEDKDGCKICGCLPAHKIEGEEKTMSKQKNSNTPILVGTLVGAFAFICIIGFFVAFICLRKKNTNSRVFTLQNNSI